MNKTHVKTLDLTGLKFSNGIVLQQVERPPHLKRCGRYWQVQCECGSICIVDGSSLKRRRWKSCGCAKNQNLEERKFGLGTVIQLLASKNNNRYWKLKCECGNFYKASTNSLIWGNNKSCGCLNARHGKFHPLYKGHEELTGDYWSKLKKGAKGRNIPFEISIEFAWELYIKQNKKCALTNWSLELGKWGKQTASIDRIDSSKGYTVENVQWVHKDINKMKQNFAEHYFILACKAVTERSLPLDLTTLRTE